MTKCWRRWQQVHCSDWRPQVARQFGSDKANILAVTLDEAIGTLLLNNQSPKPRTGDLDTRGSHFYLAMHWATGLAEQTDDAEMAAHFSQLAKTLQDNEEKIVKEMNDAQGKAVDIGGHFFADSEMTKVAMRPSPTFNEAIKAARMPGFTAEEMA